MHRNCLAVRSSAVMADDANASAPAAGDVLVRESEEHRMARRWMHATAITSISALAVTLPGQAVPALAGAGHGPSASRPSASRPAGHGPARHGRCSAGARTLSRFGAHVYPDTGN